MKRKRAYKYVIDLREKVEDTCKLAKEELAKVQTRNQQFYNRRTHAITHYRSVLAIVRYCYQQSRKSIL